MSEIFQLKNNLKAEKLKKSVEFLNLLLHLDQN